MVANLIVEYVFLDYIAFPFFSALTFSYLPYLSFSFHKILQNSLPSTSYQQAAPPPLLYTVYYEPSHSIGPHSPRKLNPQHRFQNPPYKPQWQFDLFHLQTLQRNYRGIKNHKAIQKKGIYEVFPSLTTLMTGSQLMFCL